MQLIKKAALEAVAATKPCRIVYGRVASVSPFSVRIDQKHTLSGNILVLPPRLKEILREGDAVAMLMQNGGQSYFIMERMTEMR